MVCKWCINACFGRNRFCAETGIQTRRVSVSGLPDLEQASSSVTVRVIPGLFGKSSVRIEFGPGMDYKPEMNGTGQASRFTHSRLRAGMGW